MAPFIIPANIRESTRRKQATHLSICLLSLVASLVAGLPPPHPDYVDEFRAEWAATQHLRRSNRARYPQPHRCGNGTACHQQGLNISDDRRHLVKTGQGLRVMVLLCRFTDHKDRVLPEPSYFEELLNGKGTSDVNPVGSLREWLFTNSMGKYEVTFEVQQKWRTTSNTEAHFAAGVHGLRKPEDIQQIFVPLLDELDSEGYNWADLDSDGWGDLDHLIVIHSGYPAEQGNKECTGNLAANRIWSQGTAGTTRGWTSADFSYTLGRFVIAGAFTQPQCGGKPVRLGVVAHEYMHGFRLFDLYDNDADEPPLPNLGGTGHFGIMNNLAGWTRDESIPGHLNAFSRTLAGWLDPIEITEDGYYPIQPCEFSSQIYRIRGKFAFGEYLYIENRQPFLWDSNWPDGGIVIYKIDENSDRQSARGYPGHPNWPTDHYMVSVLQADGKYDIEKGVNHGDEGDFWKFGMKLSPGGDFPNSDSLAFGNRQQTGLEIEVMSDTKYIILLRVSGLS